MEARTQPLVVVRGGGDLATGVVLTLREAGAAVIVTETDHPQAVRRAVSFCEAVHEGDARVEGVTARRVADARAALTLLRSGTDVPVLVDPELSLLRDLEVVALVDARMMKRAPGPRPLAVRAWVGLGPGFTAGRDVDAVVETQRGPTLGEPIFEGAALPNTGVPGVVGGESARRVVRAPAAGVVRSECSIGDLVAEGDGFCRIEGADGTSVIVPSPLTGRIRGLIRPGTSVAVGAKIGDVDPRGVDVDHLRVSDKARAVGRGVVVALRRFGVLEEEA